MLPRKCNRTINIVLDAWIFLEIVRDQLIGFTTRYIQPLLQTEPRDSIDDAKIYGLGLITHFASDFAFRYLVNLCSGNRMNVLIATEGFDHGRIATQVSHHAQFDLRVVRRQNAKFVAASYERRPYLASPLLANGKCL